MESNEFILARKTLKKTQQQIADLLGISIKAIRSYEQGWREIPHHAEKQILFLLHQQRGGKKEKLVCWVVKKCPLSRRKKCPAYEFGMGAFCWMVNGTICECTARKNWKEKMEICRKCSVYDSFVPS